MAVQSVLWALLAWSPWYGSCCFFWKAATVFFAKSSISSIFATFPILYVWEAATAFLHLFLSMFVKQLLLFFAKSPLSFVLPMMKLSKSIHYMEYELMIKNL